MAQVKLVVYAVQATHKRSKYIAYMLYDGNASRHVQASCPSDILHGVRTLLVNYVGQGIAGEKLLTL
jgi:hypothetical protein